MAWTNAARLKAAMARRARSTLGNGAVRLFTRARTLAPRLKAARAASGVSPSIGSNKQYRHIPDARNPRRLVKRGANAISQSRAARAGLTRAQYSKRKRRRF